MPDRCSACPHLVTYSTDTLLPVTYLIDTFDALTFVRYVGAARGIHFTNGIEILNDVRYLLKAVTDLTDRFERPIHVPQVILT